MSLRNKIWYDLVDAKYGEIYLALYITRQKKLKKIIKLTTLIFSGGGALGWSFWQYIPIIACIIISLIQVLTLVENEIVKSDREIDEICELRNLYISYFNKLDKLWYDIDNTERNTESIYFRIKKKDYEEIQVLDNKLYIRDLKILNNKADERITTFLNKYI